MRPTAVRYTYALLCERIAARLARRLVRYEEQVPDVAPRTIISWLLFPGRREDRRISRWTWTAGAVHVKLELTRTTLYYRARRRADGSLLGAWCRVVAEERDVADLEGFIATYEPGEGGRA